MTKNIDIKGRLTRWSDESAEWYETASRHTGYHDRLTEIISPWLDSEYNCCELACGTGTLARHLAPLVSSYTANDIDKNAVNFLKKQLETFPQPNMSIFEGDWHDLVGKKTFNAVIFSYFGAVLENWESLKAIASDKLIIVAPRQDGKKLRAVSEKNNIDRPEKVDRMNGHSFETYGATIEFLKEKQVSYEAQPLDLEFGQPFYDMDAAYKYVKYYYKMDDNDINEFIKIKFTKTDYGWYFPKKKEIGVICVNMKTAE